MYIFTIIYPWRLMKRSKKEIYECYREWEFLSTNTVAKFAASADENERLVRMCDVVHVQGHDRRSIVGAAAAKRRIEKWIYIRRLREETTITTIEQQPQGENVGRWRGKEARDHFGGVQTPKKCGSVSHKSTRFVKNEIMILATMSLSPCKESDVTT